MGRKITLGASGSTVAFETVNVDVTANTDAVAGGILVQYHRRCNHADFATWPFNW
jgi:hypothetical protein